MLLVLPLRGSALLRRPFLKSISCAPVYPAGCDDGGAFSGRPLPGGRWQSEHAMMLRALSPSATIFGIVGWSPGYQSAGATRSCVSLLRRPRTLLNVNCRFVPGRLNILPSAITGG